MAFGVRKYQERCIMKRCHFRPVLISILSVFFALTSTKGLPWWDEGHMVIAQIAYNRLDSNTRDEVDRLIEKFAEYAPEASDFVSAATWMDGLKYYGLEVFNEWHFIDIPYNPYGIPNIPSVGKENVLWAVTEAEETLRSKKSEDFQRALALRFLIHFVGDAHQPLHCINRYTWLHPDGDKGGNLFPLDPGCKEKELHAFWDNAAGIFGDNSDNLKANIREYADDIVEKVPPERVPEWESKDPNVWAWESYQVGINVAYSNITPGAKPSKDYIENAQSAARRRLALGGYRLAALLISIFGGNDAQ